MFEQDYIMRLIKEMVRTLLKLLFHIDTDSPSAELLKDREDKQTLETLLAMIDEGRIDDAETILDGIPNNMRSAEWHYLKGMIHQRRGWLNEAYRCYQTACRMEPSNSEYAAAFNSMNTNANGGYRTSRH